MGAAESQAYARDLSVKSSAYSRSRASELWNEPCYLIGWRPFPYHDHRFAIGPVRRGKELRSYFDRKDTRLTKRTMSTVMLSAA
jgi:hypothetical protein